MPIFVLSVLIAVLVAWIATDKVIYHGAASITPNNFKHASPTHKTVMVVPLKQLNLGSNIIVGVVSNSKALEIARAPFIRQVVVRRRLFGQPRVTRIS